MSQVGSPIRRFFEALHGDVIRELERNEFFFSDLEENIIRELSSAQAFEAIDELVPYMLAPQDADDNFWCSSLLMRLAHKSNSTEIPPALNQQWSRVIECISTRPDVLRQLKEWYRRN